MQEQITSKRALDDNLKKEIEVKSKIDAELKKEIEVLDKRNAEKSKALVHGEKIDIILQLIARPSWSSLSRAEQQEIGKNLLNLASDANWQKYSRPDIVQSVLKQARAILGLKSP